MNTLTVEPEFGPKGTIPTETPAWWACRAINQRGTVDILGDRQSAGGPARDVLCMYLDGGMLRALRERISGLWRAEPKDGAVFRFKLPAYHVSSDRQDDPWGQAEKDNVTGLLCQVRAAGGYFYIGVWAEPNAVVANLDANLAKPGSDHPTYAWSGRVRGYPRPPAPGEQVTVGMNSIGPALVLRHFTELGFLGLVVLPLDPPAWYRKQNGTNAFAHVYGMELKMPTLPEAISDVAASGDPETMSDALTGRTVVVEVPAPPVKPDISEGTKAKLRAVFQVIGQIGALKLYRETTGASLAAAKVAVAEICAGLTDSRFQVWGTAEVENARRKADGLAPSSTAEVVQRKRAEVYTVGFLADGRCLLLTRNYNGIAVVEREIGDVLIGRIKIGMTEPVITSRWDDYSLSHDAAGIPAGTPMRALWIAHRFSEDGKNATRDGATEMPANL